MNLPIRSTNEVDGSLLVGFEVPTGAVRASCPLAIRVFAFATRETTTSTITSKTMQIIGISTFQTSPRCNRRQLSRTLSALACELSARDPAEAQLADLDEHAFA
jgi:hypothetical protein